MKFAIVAYPSQNDAIASNFLSFLDRKSKYELGIGGRFRVLDFLFSVARKVETRHIFLYQQRKEDDLQNFLQNYLISDELMKVHLLQKDLHDYASDTLKILKSSRVDGVILYNADNPAIFDIEWMAAKFKDIKKEALLFTLKSPGKKNLLNSRTKFKVLFISRDFLIDQLRELQRDTGQQINIFERLMNIISMSSIPNINADGYYGVFNSVSDYYNFNINFLRYRFDLEPILAKYHLGTFLVQKGNTLIGDRGNVYNSIISENCQIHGMVVDSIIFPDVKIHEDAEIVGSVILPNNHIGKAARVHRVILDEAQVRTSKDHTLNIGDYCNVGKIEANFTGNNSQYPDILKDGLTVLGRDCSIPRKVKIGANCFISPETDNFKVKMYNRVLDGAVL